MKIEVLQWLIQMLRVITASHRRLYRRLERAVALLGVVLSLCSVCSVMAEEQRELKTESSEKVDAVLLLDASGSMLRTDPKRLREEGAKLFLQFLRPGDRIAIMQFDKESKLIRPFSDFTRDEAGAIGADITKVGTQGVYTDLLAGVQSAGELLKQEKRPDASGIILLLSDGKMEPDPAVGQAPARTEILLDSALPALRSAGIKVHTLAFSDQADKDLLSQIAVATDGIGDFASDADKIHQSFAQLFLAVKKPQVLPLTSKGFSIDPDVQEATFYVNREPDGEVTLITPKGREVRGTQSDEGIKWFRGANFDVITIVSPQPGDWLLRGMIATDGFATVLTNLKLVSDWPSSITAGEPTLLQARLNEGEKPVVLKEMSGRTRYALQILPTDKVAEPVIEDVLYDDGTHGDKIAGDGIFSYRVTLADLGDYRIWIVAKGPTFDRRQQIPFKVKPPLVSLKVVRSEESHEASSTTAEGGTASTAHTSHSDSKEGAHGAAAHDDQSQHKKSEEREVGKPVVEGQIGDLIVVELSPEATGFKNIQIKLTGVDADKRRYNLPVEKDPHDPLRYEMAASILPHTGKYDLRAELKAESKKRGVVQEESSLLKYYRPKGAGEEREDLLIISVKDEPETAPTGIPQGVLVLIINLLAGGALALQVKRAQGGTRFTLPEFVSAEPALAALSALKTRSELNEVDLNDPIFAVEEGANAAPTSQSKVAEPPKSEGATTQGGEADTPAPASTGEEQG